MDGEYPAEANPCKNLPTKIIGRFWEDAIRIHPRISGMVKKNKDFLLPNFDPNRAAANPPKIAPNPNIPAERNNLAIRNESKRRIHCYVVGK